MNHFQCLAYTANGWLDVISDGKLEALSVIDPQTKSCTFAFNCTQTNSR